MVLFLGYDVSCVAATGFGKSLAFQMAVMVMKQFGIVITPLNRLGKDEVAKCKKYGLRAVMLTGEVLETDIEIIKRIMKCEYDLGIYPQIKQAYILMGTVYMGPEKIMQPNQPLP